MEPLMTPDEVAGVLRVPLRTLAYWRMLEEGPMHVRIGKHVRYDPDEVRAYRSRPARYNERRRRYDDLAAYQERSAA